MSVKKNVAYSWGAHLTIALSGLFLMPYVLKTVGDPAYGAWLLLNAISQYAKLLYLGFGETTARYVSTLAAKRDYCKLNDVASCVFAVYLGSATVAFLLTVLVMWLAPGMSDWGGVPIFDVQVAIFLLGLNMVIGIAGSVNGGLLMGVQRFDIERGIQVLTTILRLVMVVYFLQEQRGLITLGLCFLAMTVLENVLHYWFARRELPGLKLRVTRLDRGVLKDCFAFSAFTSIVLVSEYLIYTTDTVVIGFMLGAAAVVPYGIAHRITDMFYRPLEQIGVVVMPKAGELDTLDRGDELRRMTTQAISLVFLLTAGFWVGSAFFGDMFINVWIGPGYPEAHTVMIILVAALVVATPVGVLRRILVGMGVVRWPSLLYFAEAVLNLILSLVLVRFYGIYGVALGTLIPVVAIGLFVLFPLAVRRLEMRVRDVVSEIGRTSVLPLGVMAGFCYVADRANLPESWASLISVTCVGGALLLGTRFGFAKLLKPKQILTGAAT